MKVTGFPAQTMVAVAETETDTGSKGFTVMMMAFEVTGFAEMHEESDEVSSQVTTSPFTGV